MFNSLFCHADSLKPPPLTLAKTYKGQVDLTQYWASEKLDGVRAYWDGQQLISRQGHPYPAPPWFTKDFPKQALDGELWLERGQFQTLLSIVKKKQAVKREWQQIRYFVFDIPEPNKPFTERLTDLKRLVSLSRNPYLKLVEQFKIANKLALQQKLSSLVKKGAEGLMLHRANALYHVGRTNNLLKVKPYFDAEATVIAYVAGKGKYSGMVGSLLVETQSGIQFKIGSGFTDFQRMHPPMIGKTITFTYHGKTLKGIPKFASFLRVREKN